MTDLLALLAATSAAVIGLTIASTALLRGWRGWLLLKRAEIISGSRGRRLPAGRNELAALRERVRKLEAIASGID